MLKDVEVIQSERGLKNKSLQSSLVCYSAGKHDASNSLL